MNARHSSKKPDWTTPPWLIEAARRVLGTIDLDPASSERSNEIVMAKRFFDEKQDGLQQPWRVSMKTPKHRGIWLNPPGGKTVNGESRSKLFWQRLVFERQVNPEFGDALFLAYSIEMAQIQPGQLRALAVELPHVLSAPPRRVLRRPETQAG